MPGRIPSCRTSPRPESTPHREYDRSRRDEESKRFYNSSAWRKTRALVLASRPLCDRCRAVGLLRPASHVHHLVELRRDPSLALDVDNLQPLCHACHSRLHASRPDDGGGG